MNLVRLAKNLVRNKTVTHRKLKNPIGQVRYFVAFVTKCLAHYKVFVYILPKYIITPLAKKILIALQLNTMGKKKMTKK